MDAHQESLARHMLLGSQEALALQRLEPLCHQILVSTLDSQGIVRRWSNLEIPEIAETTR